MTIREIAIACHQVNRAYCQALGDNSQPEWADTPDWYKDTIVMGAGLYIYHPEYGPEHSHICWFTGLMQAGWKCGPVQDIEKKEHPYLVPFEELSIEQQTKNILFRDTVLGLRSRYFETIGLL